MVEEMRRGQVAIFVIIAVVIVVGVFFIFAIRDSSLETTISPEKNPEAFVEKCLKDAVEEAVEIMIPQGGFIEPEDFILYNDTKVPYLCKNIGNFKPCINHHPMLLNDIEVQLGEYVTPRVQNCLMTVKSEFEKQGYTVVLSDIEIDLDLSPGVIRPTMVGRVAMTRRDEARSFENIDAKVDSSLYDLTRVAMEIVNSESQFCYFEYVGYVSYYPQFMIKKTTAADTTRIYTIIDREGKGVNEMNIAIRGCVIPPGI